MSKTTAFDVILASRLYHAVVQPDTIWWDDLTPEIQAGWLRAAAVAATLARPDRALDERLLARAYAEAGYGPVLSADEWADIAAEYARLAQEGETQP